MSQRTLVAVAVTAGLAAPFGAREIIHNNNSFRDPNKVAQCAEQLGPIAVPGHMELPEQCETFRAGFPRQEMHKLTITPEQEAPLANRANGTRQGTTVSTIYTHISRQEFNAQVRSTIDTENRDGNIAFPMIGLCVAAGVLMAPRCLRGLRNL